MGGWGVPPEFSKNHLIGMVSHHLVLDAPRDFDMQYLRNAQSDFDPVFFYLFVFSSSVTYVKTEKMVFTPPPPPPPPLALTYLKVLESNTIGHFAQSFKPAARIPSSDHLQETFFVVEKDQVKRLT